MTEVEFPRLLSELTETAKRLNLESDSINELIDRFGEKLRKINLGLEVWLSEYPLKSSSWSDEDDEGNTIDEGRENWELGFTKLDGEWSLAERRAWYRKDIYGQLNLEGDPEGQRLVKSSRDRRIAALKLFPELARKMKAEAAAALKAIEEAKKLVE